MPDPTLNDPFKTYNGPPVTQQQIDPHDPSQAIDDIKNWGKSQYNKYGPAFQKYFDKAMEHAQNAGNAVGNAAGAAGNAIGNGMNAANDFMTAPANNKAGLEALGQYQSFVKFAQQNASLVNTSGQIINQAYQLQLNIQQAYKDFITINDAAKKFITQDGRFISTGESQNILAALKNSHDNIDVLMARLQKVFETGFDKMSTYKSNTNKMDMGAIKPITGI